jgi:small subunit ribosomal protein S8
MQDPIGDMFAHIKTAQAANKKDILMPGSKLKVKIAELLKEEGYITDFVSEQNAGKPELRIHLKYYRNQPVITEFKRVSRPSVTVCCKANSLSKIKKHRFGIAMISTSQGLMTDLKAMRLNQGGIVIGVVS